MKIWKNQISKFKKSAQALFSFFMGKPFDYVGDFIYNRIEILLIINI